jgi:hypothetical protein
MFLSRNKTDNYETNKESWIEITEYVPKDKIVWCPFYCSGKQGKIFKELGYTAIHEDKDFFKYEPEYDIICCNPPFSIIRDISIRLHKLGKPFIIVAPSRLIMCRWFNELFKKDLGLIIPAKRPTFNNIETPNKSYSPPFGTFYYAWKTELTGKIIYI